MGEAFGVGHRAGVGARVVKGFGHVEAQIKGQGGPCRSRVAGAWFAVVLVVGFAANVLPPAAAEVVQEGDNEADLEQDGEAISGDAVVGQVVGIVSSGDVSVDARNHVEDADARSGDAEASNSAVALVGDSAVEPTCPEPLVVGAQQCPEGFVGAEIEADSIDAAIVHAGDNELEIDQSATATTGDALAGAQVIGVTAAGTVDIVVDNFAEDVDARSGDAEAHNDIEDAEAGDFVEFFCADCLQEQSEAGASSIDVTTITAAIVHDGDNELDIDQTAIASTGDAVAGSQVVGVVTSSTGDVSIDARNRADDVEAETGDAEASNEIEQAIAGDTVLDAPCETCEVLNGDAAASGIDANQIDAVIVHAGDNELDIDQTAIASTGDAVAGSQVIGAVAAGVIDIVADNVGTDAEAESGDAEASNDLGNAQTGDFVGFACEECPLPGVVEDSSIQASSITAVIVHDGDNELDINQTATASTGDAVSGSQVIGAVTSATGQISIDARNRGEDVEAETGDAEASNEIDEAISGDTVLDAPCEVCEFTDDLVLQGIEATTIDAVIVHSGDNELDIDQTALASSGDAVSGSQVIGAVGGGVIDIVADNVGIDAEAESGDAEASNEIVSAEAGNLVDFFAGCPEECPLPGDGAGASGIDVASLSAVIAQDGDNELDIDQTAIASTGDAVAGSQVIGAVAAAGGDVSIDARNRGEDVEAETGDAEAENFIGDAIVGNVALNVPTTSVSVIGSGDNELDIDQVANASSGDAVAGAQVIGVIGGNVDAVLDNVGRDADTRSGDTETDNDASAQVGASFLFEPTSGSLAVTGAVIVGLASLVLTRIGRRRRKASHAGEGSIASATTVPPTEASGGSPQHPVSVTRVVTTGIIVVGGILLARRLGRH